MCTGQVRPVRGAHGDRALRPAGGPRDGRRALRLGSESVLGGGQRLVAPGRGIRPPLGGPVPNLRLVHCPVHSSWLNQVEIYFSVVQRKVLTPNDFVDLGEVERRLLAFERRYEEAARPFEWKFTRADLARLMRRLRARGTQPAAA